MARKEKTYSKLKNKFFRLVLLDPETLEERYATNIRPLRIFIGLVLLSMLFLGLAFSTFYYTPLKFTLPGYGKRINEQKLAQLKENVSTLESQISLQNQYIRRVRSLISGVPVEELSDSILDLEEQDVENFQPVNKSQEDSILRNMQEKKQRLSALNKMDIISKDLSSKEISLKDIDFYPPIKGSISKKFNASDSHLGIDIIAPQNTAIKSIRDGIVIFSGWTRETGYTMVLQHEENLLSFYKHNSKNLKSVGEKVNAGEAIAIIGNTGEQTTGPHLHFELWHRGVSLDPSDFITFDQ